MIVAQGDRNGCDYDRATERGQNIASACPGGKRRNAPMNVHTMLTDSCFMVGRRIHVRVSTTLLFQRIKNLRPLAGQIFKLF